MPTFQSDHDLCSVFSWKCQKFQIHTTKSYKHILVCPVYTFEVTNVQFFFVNQLDMGLFQCIPHKTKTLYRAI